MCFPGVPLVKQETTLPGMLNGFLMIKIHHWLSLYFGNKLGSFRWYKRRSQCNINGSREMCLLFKQAVCS